MFFSLTWELHRLFPQMRLGVLPMRSVSATWMPALEGCDAELTIRCSHSEWKAACEILALCLLCELIIAILASLVRSTAIVFILGVPEQYQISIVYCPHPLSVAFIYLFIHSLFVCLLACFDIRSLHSSGCTCFIFWHINTWCKHAVVALS